MFRNSTENYNKILIVSGGTVSEEHLKKHINDYGYDYVIGVDRGLCALHNICHKPDLSVGDFDSIDTSIRSEYISSPGAIVLNPEKDYSDTHMAVIEALKHNPKEIVLLGATGNRVDHMLANIGLLKFCHIKGVKLIIEDLNNRIYVIDEACTIKKKKAYGKYVSLVPFSDIVKGITLKGFKYPLDNATMVKEESIGISNEIREEECHITIKEGYLLVMETKD